MASTWSLPQGTRMSSVWIWVFGYKLYYRKCLISFSRNKFWCLDTIGVGSFVCQNRGPFHLRFFARNSNSMETSPCSNSITGHQIATNFCTCHDSTAVVPCTKFCSDHCIGIEMRPKRNFHRIWIAMEKPLVKRGPVHEYATSSTLMMTWSMYASLNWNGNVILRKFWSLAALSQS